VQNDIRSPQRNYGAPNNRPQNPGQTRPGMPSWQPGREGFVNPYNFVGLYGECQRQNMETVWNEKGRLTGYIECSITSQTPVFIPNSSYSYAFTKQASSCKSYDFFSYEEIKQESDRNRPAPCPVIPGTELRGVIRSAYEAVSRSCMSTTSEETVPYKRTPLPGQPAILKLENGCWRLYQADRVMLKTRSCVADPELGPQGVDISQYREGELVHVKLSTVPYKGRQFMPRTVVQIDRKAFPGSIQGFIHKGEPFPRKHHESVFIPREKSVLTVAADSQVGKDLIWRLNQVVTLYRDEGVNINRKQMGPNRHSGYEEFALQETGTLVYYTTYNNTYYLSPSCISKEVFNTNIVELAKSQGGYEPCVQLDKLCPACRLFGMVKDKQALGSRLRFTDAYLKDESVNLETLYESLVVLDEQSAPKLSATEFYLAAKPGDRPDLWNYDYAGVWRGSRLEVIAGYRAQLRGRKFYWHSSTPKWQTLGPQSSEALERGDFKRRTVIRPLKKGVEFGFRVFFDGITVQELHELVWILNIGDKEEQRCHKIGRGKPLGLGSVKIQTENILLRTFEVDEQSVRYKVTPYEMSAEELEKTFDKDRKEVQELLRITDFANMPKHVAYPRAIDERGKSAIYLWFIANRQLQQGSAQKPVINYVLPSILDANLELPVLERLSR
jgi:CRISPR-associated protein (TIGR03986 family)